MLSGVMLYHASSLMAMVVAKGFDPHSSKCAYCGECLYCADSKLIVFEEKPAWFSHFGCLPLVADVKGSIRVKAGS
jgi:polyferredoxin